jgi:putative Holliday junction resolvase
VAGIDYGDVRLGVALSDARRSIATPLTTYARRGLQADAQWFRALAAEHDIKLFVVGLPVHLDGRESQKSLAARKFGQWLAEVTGVEVVFFDERFTTAEAEEHLRAAGLTSKQRKQRRDRLAAQIILRDFLASGGAGQDAPGGLDG